MELTDSEISSAQPQCINKSKLRRRTGLTSGRTFALQLSCIQLNVLNSIAEYVTRFNVHRNRSLEEDYKVMTSIF